jgi:hypothetical protein
MPNYFNYVNEPERLPTSQINVAPADVAVGVGGTYVTAATLGTLPPGLYLVSASVSYLNGAGAAFVNTKLVVGTTIYAPTEGSCIATGAIQLATPATPIEITAAAGAAVIVQCTSTTATGSVKAAQVNGGANAGATWISALRIR